jgi:hypothetical protein
MPECSATVPTPRAATATVAACAAARATAVVTAATRLTGIYTQTAALVLNCSRRTMAGSSTSGQTHQRQQHAHCASAQFGEEGPAVKFPG